MESKLTLNDGTILEDSEALESDGKLFIYIRNGMGLREVFEQLIEPEKTKKIIREQYGIKTTLRGYKKLIAARDEGNGLITAVIER